MADKPEDIQKFLESLPEKFEILEEGIDFQTQKEYIKHSGTFDRGSLTENETLELATILFDEAGQLDIKKRVLVLLAHLGTILSFMQIEQYLINPDQGLKQWALLSLQECKMFLVSS